MTFLPLIAFFRSGDKGDMYIRLIEEMGIEVIAVAVHFSTGRLSCMITDTVYLIGDNSEFHRAEVVGGLEAEEVFECVAAVRNLVI